METTPAYGLWLLAIVNAAFFILFAFSFTKPRTARDWRSFGAFSAFIVALFTEMYGFPLTIYLLSGWLARRYPEIDFLTHDAGHLWNTVLGFEGNPHLGALHLLSNVAIAGGFILLAAAWRTLYQAQREGRLATTGVYARMRHPQYAAFILIMFGFLLQWPTLLTLVMFPVLVVMYVRLARREEQDALHQFGEAYRRYMATTPAWLPALRATALPLAALAVLGGGPARASGGWIYTADEKGNTITVVDLALETAMTIKVPISPHNVQISGDGRLLLATGVASGHGAHDGKVVPGRLLAYDSGDVARGPIADIPVGPHPAHVVTDRDGRLAYVSDSAENAVYVIDIGAREVLGRIATGRYPHGLRISPDGRELYTANIKGNTVSVIDLAGRREVARIAVGKSPVQVGFTPDGRRLYVSLNAENAVAVLDPATRQVLGRIAVGRNPVQVYGTPDGRFVYAANQGTEANPAETVSVIDTTSDKVIATLVTGKGAHGVVAGTRSDRVFVTNFAANTVSIIDVAAQKVVGTINVGRAPNGITFRE
jgi:YVTN family beta-propeller protein